MPVLTMDAHQRTGVLRCDGCWSATTLELPAWGIAVEHRGAVQTVTRRLVRPAVAEATVVMVAFALVRHVDGIIVEICEAVTWSPDATGQLCGRLLWSGVRTTPPAHPIQRVHDYRPRAG